MAPASTAPASTDVEVSSCAGPAQLLEAAGDFLRSDPVAHNLILTLLEARVRSPEPGRYWLARTLSGPGGSAPGNQGSVAGVVFNSPPTFVATLPPMTAEVSRACARALVAAGVELPGVNGDAGTAAAFAGQWAESAKVPATPWQGQRLYQATEVLAAPAVGGRLRRAQAEEAGRMVEWLEAFHHEATPGEAFDAVAAVARRMGAGELWVWDDGGARSMAALTPPVAGVVRVGPVYTPDAGRGRGYGGAVVAGLTAQSLAEGLRPILYTDLANPVSNSVYRRIGYHCVREILRYRFG